MQISVDILVVSDSHIFHGTEERERSLVNLIKGETWDTLILLGDIYDFWYEYRSVVPRYGQILAATVITLAQEREIHYVSGNHDAWVGKFWRDAGIRVHRYGFQRKIFKKNYLFTHGDYLFGRRSGFTRALFHSGWANFLFSLLHPDIGVVLASKLSKESRKREEELDFSRLEKIVSKRNIDVVVSGHLHIPMIKEVKDKLFVCAGDWMEKFTYLKITEAGLEIKDKKGETLMFHRH